MVLFLGILLVLPLYLLCVVVLFLVWVVGWLTRKIIHRFFLVFVFENGKGKG